MGDDGGFDGEAGFGDDGSGSSSGGSSSGGSSSGGSSSSGSGAPAAHVVADVDGGTSSGSGGSSGGSSGGNEGPIWYPGGQGFFAYGAGGGQSILWDEPTYQQGIVPASLSNGPGGPARVVPDVGMLADPNTGMLIGQTIAGFPSESSFVEFPIGGTSLASPLFAGVIALAQQHAGHAFGFANTLLYKASKKGAFRDIGPLASPQAVSVGTFGIVNTFEFENQSIHTAAGFDEVTGLGAPNGTSFLGAVK
jgi:subtilase family serine protease